MTFSRIALAAFILSLSIVSTVSIDVICYTLSWSQYKSSPVNFLMSDVPGDLCDQVLYSFFAVGDDFKLKTLDPTDYENIRTLVAKKSESPNMKVLVAVGGWSHSAGFVPMAATRQNRAIFIDSVMAFLEEYGVDGIDLDWEYPTANERQTFVDLCQEMKAAFGDRYILSAAVSVGSWAVDQIYDVAALSQHLDHIGVMSYDMASCGWGPVEHQSPLHASQTSTQPSLVCSDRMEYFVEQGATRNKMVLGLGFYGRGSTISTDSASIGDNVANGCIIGPYTQESGFRAYYEICKYADEGMHRVFDESARVPIATGNNMWIGYDDQQSLIEKVNFAKEKNYGGVMIWAIDFDDFKGAICGQGSFPLLTKVHETAKSGGSPPTTTQRPPNTTTQRPPNTTTQSSSTQQPTGTTATLPTITTSAAITGDHGRCSCGKPLEPNFDNGCQSFFYCEAGQAEVDCPPGTLFSLEQQVCDHANNVDCRRC
ncbi:hypothetical protein ACOME3_005355 [Neoechinorhynchus agilis]